MEVWRENEDPTKAIPDVAKEIDADRILMAVGNTY